MLQSHLFSSPNGRSPHQFLSGDAAGTFLFWVLMLSPLILSAQINVFPYTEDLESQVPGTTTCGDAQILSIDWTNDTGDDIDWVADVDGTGSANTGPTANGGADHNPGVAGGIYLYTEASGCALDTANLISPEVQTNPLAPNLFFEFWYHQYGADINVLMVQTRLVVGGIPGPWTDLDTLFTPPPGLDQWQQALYDLTSFVGDTFQIRLRGVTGGSFGSDLAIDDFSLYSLSPTDIGVVSIDQPINPITAGLNNVDVSIRNFGTDLLTQAQINWSFNGAIQPVASWTGSLALNQTSMSYNIGAINIPAGLHRIKAWTSGPNGMLADLAPNNDTSEILLCTPLAGIYTLGGPGADFVNFTEAGSVLSQCGVSGDVTINVAPGIYNERLILDHVPGTGPAAMITIDGGDSSLVKLIGSSFSTVYLNGTDYTSLKNMTIQALGTTDSYGIQLRDTAEHNTIDQCLILMSLELNLSDVVGVSASDSETSSLTEGQNALYTTVSNCHTIGGEKGIHFEGQNTLRTVGNRFLNNWIDQPEDYGFYIDDQDSLEIIGNTITGIRNSAGDGIYGFDLQDFNISENMATDVPDWGLFISDGNFSGDGTPTQRGKIINNMISSQTDYAAYFTRIEQTDIWHNTFANRSSLSGAFRINDFTDIDIQNNIFYSDGDFAFEADDPSNGTPNTINYNLYFSTSLSPNLVKDGIDEYADLVAWQAGRPTLNLNSLEEDPVFLNNLKDLHVLSPVPNDAGTNSLGITVDIDGDIRPQVPSSIVDMGADEFTPRSDDAVAVLIYEPVNGCGDSSTVVSAVIQNLGVNAITLLPITVNVTGSLTQTLTQNYNGNLLFTESDTVTIGTINTYAGGTFIFDGFVNLAGDEEISNDTFPQKSVDFIPVVLQGIDAMVCNVDTAILRAVTYPGASYSWFANNMDAVPLATADSFIVPSIMAQNTYYLGYTPQYADSLVTTYLGGNGASGNMFDIQANQTITITGFAGNFNSGTNIVDVYYRTDSYTNNPNDPAGWIQVVSGATVVSSGNGAGTMIPEVLNITIGAGQTYGFYIICTSGGVAYTNGTTEGSVLVSDSRLTVFEGTGRGLPLFTGGTNSPRSFNGTIFYGLDPCSDIRVPVSALNDTTPPVPVCQNIMLQLDETGNASITPAEIDNGSNDNCDIAALSLDKMDFTCADAGAQIVTLTVMDAAGNSSNCQATVTVLISSEPCGFPPCLPLIDIDKPFLAHDPHQSDFHAGVKLVANGIITTSEVISFKAGNEVELRPEFVVLQGAVLTMDIEPCIGPPANSEKAQQ